MFQELGWEAWITITIIGVMLFTLAREYVSPDLTMLCSIGMLLLFGILSPEQAFAGFSNQAVLTVASLFVVAAGVQQTGALQFTDRLLFPRSNNLSIATARLMLTTATMSAFLNNTPIVAMLIPRVRDWCTAKGIPTSKLMIPLSYAAIVGGMITIIGTSTNLLVFGILEAEGYQGINLFDMAWTGIPAAVGVILYFILFGKQILPDRILSGNVFEEGLKDCFIEVRVSPDSPLIGRTVEEAELRALEDAYLVHIHRDTGLISASPRITLRKNDVLTFLGSAAVLDKLLEKPGIVPAQESLESTDHTTLPLFEAVISPTSNLVGKSLYDTRFRENYHGVVLGIQRSDINIDGPLAKVTLEAGDLLLVEAVNGFDKRWNQNREEFYLVAPRRGEMPKQNRKKAPLAVAILCGVIFLAAFNVADIVVTAFVGALAMVGTGCLRGGEARQAVDPKVLVVIAAALGLSQAIENAGLAAMLGETVTALSSIWGTIGVIAVIYLATSMLTEVITNNAAAALMIGISLAAADTIGAPPEAFAIAVATAASASFITPIGYQTNLMVMSAGGYRFSDYIRTGIFVNLLVMIIVISMIWLVWL